MLSARPCVGADVIRAWSDDQKPGMTDLTSADFLRLFILALPVAAISWTVTHEELFREVHSYCVDRSKSGQSLPVRKFFYLLTCEYCFSHYVSAAMLWMTGFHLLYSDWRGALI